MNKIIEASEAVAKAYAKWWLYAPDDFTNGYYAKLELLRDALRAEINSVEEELTALVAENENISNLWSLVKKERDELQAKIAAMEGQEPVAYVDYDGFIVERHFDIAPGQELYLAPGAKP